MGDTCSACKAHGQQAEIRNINLQSDKENKVNDENINTENMNGSSSAKEKVKNDEKSNHTQSSKNFKMNKTTYKKNDLDV